MNPKTLEGWFVLGVLAGFLFTTAYWCFAIAVGSVAPPWAYGSGRLTIQRLLDSVFAGALGGGAAGIGIWLIARQLKRSHLDATPPPKPQP